MRSYLELCGVMRSYVEVRKADRSISKNDSIRLNTTQQLIGCWAHRIHSREKWKTILRALRTSYCTSDIIFYPYRSGLNFPNPNSHNLCKKIYQVFLAVSKIVSASSLMFPTICSTLGSLDHSHNRFWSCHLPPGLH